MVVKFIDLFAGLGGMRLGLEQACTILELPYQCVFTSEVKSPAIATYEDNFKNSDIQGDITKIAADDLPNFDILLAGFPCQPFSSAGNRQGFLDTRGTLFFEIERILEAKHPQGFILENVEGLVKHDQGRTLETIIVKLEQLGYSVTWKVLDAQNFGIPQERRRIYIVGSHDQAISLDFGSGVRNSLESILEKDQPLLKTTFTEKLLALYSLQDLAGKAIKDKRGGQDNIHSWDLELKGAVSPAQKDLLNQLLKERRKKIWAKYKGITWMDGMPLTLQEIESFYTPNIFTQNTKLETILDDLVTKGYLRFEHPKDIVEVKNSVGKLIKKRAYRTDLPKGYNIVVGKLSFPLNEILDPQGVTPTLLATDMAKLAVIDGPGLRQLTIREGLRLFGFPENYQINLSQDKAYDLLGNTVVVTVIKEIAIKLLTSNMLFNKPKTHNAKFVCKK
jgi:DNA (cytosine-5)-methyltransferase 1